MVPIRLKSVVITKQGFISKFTGLGFKLKDKLKINIVFGLL